MHTYIPHQIIHARQGLIQKLQNCMHDIVGRCRQTDTIVAHVSTMNTCFGSLRRPGKAP